MPIEMCKKNVRYSARRSGHLSLQRLSELGSKVYNLGESKFSDRRHLVLYLGLLVGKTEVGWVKLPVGERSALYVCATSSVMRRNEVNLKRTGFKTTAFGREIVLEFSYVGPRLRLLQRALDEFKNRKGKES